MQNADFAMIKMKLSHLICECNKIAQITRIDMTDLQTESTGLHAKNTT